MAFNIPEWEFLGRALIRKPQKKKTDFLLIVM